MFISYAFYFLWFSVRKGHFGGHSCAPQHLKYILLNRVETLKLLSTSSILSLQNSTGH